jgi:hypothetical protein
METKRYFGGSTVKGKVRRLKAKTFKQLVEHYFNAPVLKTFTRKEFHSYDSETMKLAKDGHFVTAAVFDTPEGVECDRTLANCQGVTLALLDFDSTTEQERAEGYVDYASQFYDAPEFVRNALHPFNFVFYETISSTATSRRVRLLVDLQEMPPKMHRLAVLRVADLLGVTPNRWKGRIESMTLPLPMFRPVQFQDENYTAILASRTEGVEMEELDIPEADDGLGDDAERTYGYQGDGFADDDLMYCPVAGVSIENVKEILNFLDADKSYWAWMQVGMALRHQFRDEEEAKKAFDLYDEWSSQGKSDKYVDTDEVWKKWQNFKPDPERRRPTTIRTVFDMAKEAGWDSAPMAKQVKRTVSAWIKLQVDPDELFRQGPTKIAALPFQDPLTEEGLAMDLQIRIKELDPNGKAIALPLIRKAIKACRRQKAKDENPAVPAWTLPWVYISTRNVVRNLTTGTELSPEAFNRTFAVELMSDSAESESTLTGRPTMQPMDYILNVLKVKRVEGTAYSPKHGGGDHYYEFDGRTYLNEYRISTVPGTNPAKAEACGKIFSHAVEVTFGKEHHKLMMDFFAHIVQRPGVLIRWVPLCQSAQGSGKNMICKCIGHAIGMANFKPVNAKQVVGNFNDWIYGAQFIVLDEVKITGKTKAEMANALKDIITNDEVSMEAKHQNLRIIENVACKIANTNWQDAIFMENSDRRWYPIKSPLQTKAHLNALNATGHFKRLAQLYKHGGALRHFLLEWPIAADFPTDGPAPETDFRQEMIMESKNGLEEQIEDVIHDEKVPTVGKDVIFLPHLITNLTDLKNNYKPSHFLKMMQFSPWKSGGKFMLSNVRGSVWVHADFDSTLDPMEVLKERNALDIDID